MAFKDTLLAPLKAYVETENASAQGLLHIVENELLPQVEARMALLRDDWGHECMAHIATSSALSALLAFLRDLEMEHPLADIAPPEFCEEMAQTVQRAEEVLKIRGLIKHP